MEININGITLNLNVFEANQARKLVESYENVAKEAEQAQGKSMPEQIDIQCEAVKAAFDNIFGEGTGTAICGCENDLMKCIDAYTVLCEEKNRQEQMLDEKTNYLLSMYPNEKTNLLPMYSDEENEFFNRKPT